MRDPKSGIEVLIRAHGYTDAFAEVIAPRTSRFLANDRNECFIEAAPNTEYGFNVIVPDTFDWMDNPRLLVRYRLEEDAFENAEVLLNPHDEGTDVYDDGPPPGFRLNYHSEEDEEDVGMKRVKYCRVHKNEGDLYYPAHQYDFVRSEQDTSLHSAERRKIEVTIQRGRALSLHQHPYAAGYYGSGLDAFLGETGKILEVDNAHISKKPRRPMAGRKSAPQYIPLQDHIVWIPGNASAEEEITFTFYYATKSFLEKQGIMHSISTVTGDREVADDTDPTLPAYNLRERSAKLPAAQAAVPKTRSKTKAAANAGAGLSKADKLKAKQSLYKDADQDDEEPFPRKRSKLESKIKTEAADFYDSTSPRPASNDGVVSKNATLTPAEKSKRRAEIKRRLEEMQLQREFAQLEDAE
ncbi:hypothetical protein LTR36_000390 [Oleoguttula mirabilis]|uniref:Uncharacterized protein n=1 Tax=Oleoguttula mirabilis TaxID=1507867 RepID=A0AAV9JYK3_9PEZI|nr:hypothetical protein LTR36_000390 [Oleoguttula mirabilis]